jgi:hypothetical protein
VQNGNDFVNRSTQILNLADSAIGLMDNVATKIKAAISSIQQKVKTMLKIIENKMLLIVK